jgi:hypothetical protein
MDVDHTESPRDRVLTLMFQTIISSPMTIRLINQFLVVCTNILIAATLGLLASALVVGFIIQGFATFSVLEKFMTSLNGLIILTIARVVSLGLFSACFSRGVDGDKEKLAIGIGKYMFIYKYINIYIYVNMCTYIYVCICIYIYV